MRFFYGLNKLQTASLFPLMICSVFFALAEILLLLGSYFNNDTQLFLNDFSDLLVMLTGYVFCYFLTLKLTDGRHSFKCFWSVLCLAVFNTAVHSFYSDSGSVYFTGIVIALFCSFCFNKFDNVLALSVTIISSILFGILFGFAVDYWNNFVMWLADFIVNKSFFSPVMFSVFDSVLSLFGIDTLKDMIFYKSYGGSIFYGSELITGVKDLFSSGYNGELVSEYLSGHYFLMFALVGIAISLMSDLKGTQKYVLAVVTAGAIISGNFSLIFLFLLLESPFVFIAVLIISAIAYLSAYVLNLSVGYIFSGGIIEMIANIDNVVYLLAGGVVFAAMGFFVYKYCYEKYGISDCLNTYIPSRLSAFVKALGGMGNIVRFKDSGLEVRNPKLIDCVSIDCEINENIIVSDDERFNELKEYL